MRLALGAILPVQLLIQPVLNGDTVVGVLELANLQPFSVRQRQFLEQTQGTLATALVTVQARQRVNELLLERSMQGPERALPNTPMRDWEDEK